MSLPQKLPLDLMQTKWAQDLDPVLRFPPIKGVLLKEVWLSAGANVINHKLGRKLQGWIPTRIRASATLHDEQDSNPTPTLTLTLQASADVIVDLWVY